MFSCYSWIAAYYSDTFWLVSLSRLASKKVSAAMKLSYSANFVIICTFQYTFKNIPFHRLATDSRFRQKLNGSSKLVLCNHSLFKGRDRPC